MIATAMLYIAKFAFLALCGSLVYILLLYVRQIPLYMRTWKINGAKALPFIGHAHKFMGDDAQNLNIVLKLVEPFASPIRVWLGFKLLVGVFDPEQVKILLNSPNALNKSEVYKFVENFIGSGLVTAPSKQWQVHRKLIGPAFNSKMLASYVAEYAKQSLIMIDLMETELNGGEFNIERYVTPWATDVMFETLMEISMHAQANGDSSCLDRINGVLDMGYNRTLKIWLHPDFIFNRTSIGRKFHEYVKFVHGFTEKVIRKKKLQLQEETTTPEETYIDHQKQHKTSYLNNLMNHPASGKKLSDLEIRDEITTMMIAAADTVRTTVTFAMFSMANYPDLQEKVYKELYEIYGATDPLDRPVTKDDLSRMEYLECFIKETLRLFPALPIIARQLTDDIQIGSCTLPKGVDLFIPIFAIQRSSEYWKDPLKFDPDRFLPENSVNRHSHSFIPFSGGPRNCLGGRHAMFLMKIGLATILRRYRLKREKILDVKDIPLSGSVTLHTSVPLTVSIERRI